MFSIDDPVKLIPSKKEHLMKDPFSKLTDGNSKPWNSYVFELVLFNVIQDKLAPWSFSDVD
jgi:N-acyl-L-homoserine lactone synthetase